MPLARAPTPAPPLPAALDGGAMCARQQGWRHPFFLRFAPIWWASARISPSRYTLHRARRTAFTFGLRTDERARARNRLLLSATFRGTRLCRAALPPSPRAAPTPHAHPARKIPRSVGPKPWIALTGAAAWHPRGPHHACNEVSPEICAQRCTSSTPRGSRCPLPRAGERERSRRRSRAVARRSATRPREMLRCFGCDRVRFVINANIICAPVWSADPSSCASPEWRLQRGSASPWFPGRHSSATPALAWSCP